MSKLSDKLQTALETRLNSPTKVWYDPRYGWLFQIEDIPHYSSSPQLIGYNYKQAERFITKSYALKMIKEDLQLMKKLGKEEYQKTIRLKYKQGDK